MKAYIFHIFMIGTYSPPREEVWEECLRVYYDESRTIALARVKNDAQSNEISYETNDGFILTWAIHSIRLINELDYPLLEGEDLFSRSLSSKEAYSLLKSIE
jgi:hypothetical protein